MKLLLALLLLLKPALGFQVSGAVQSGPLSAQKTFISASSAWPNIGTLVGLAKRSHVPLQLSSSTESNLDTPKKFDGGAVIKYATAIAIQMGLFFAIFTGFDKLVAAYSLKIPFAVNFILFYFFALKSRILNPLSNQRPKVATKEIEGESKRVMPSWTPPGFIFPIVWLLIIAPIRAFSSAMVYQGTSSYASPAILALMLHLSIGDVWNTINNVEKRYGTSVVGVLLVWLSKAHAAYRYYQVVPAAGKLLAVPLVWLTIASTLITATWRLNPGDDGKCDPLYPIKGGKAETKFAWFASE